MVKHHNVEEIKKKLHNCNMSFRCVKKLQRHLWQIFPQKDLIGDDCEIYL